LTRIQNAIGNYFGYGVQDSAARAALNEANPQSISDNLEYGGLIYQLGGDYHFTSPLKGTATGFSPSMARQLVPQGALVVGDYHTHGDYSRVVNGNPMRTRAALDQFNSDHFSTSDILGIQSDGRGIPTYRGYLGTPSGVFRVFDPATGTQYILK
jgi:hypothetical protein